MDNKNGFMKNIDWWLVGWAGLFENIVIILTFGTKKPSWSYNTLVRLDMKRIKEAQEAAKELSEMEW